MLRRLISSRSLISSTFSSSISSFHVSPPIFSSFSRQFASIPLKVPSMGDSISDGSLIELLKSKGDSVKENEIVARIETDKVAIDIRADRDGLITAMAVKVGENVKVGQTIMEIEGGAGGKSETSKPVETKSQANNSSASTPAVVASSASSSSSSASSPPPYDPKIRFVHGSGRNEFGDFPNQKIHRNAESKKNNATAAQTKSATPAAAKPATGGVQPTIQPDAYWAQNPREFQEANLKAGLAIKSLPAMYRRPTVKPVVQSLIDFGGAPDYEIKQKGKAAKE